MKVFNEPPPTQPIIRPGYWAIDEGINGRLFLEEFARKRGFDPLSAHYWYQVKFQDIIQAGVCVATVIFVVGGVGWW